MNKKILAISIVFILLIAFSASANISNFTDIQNSEWYSESVNNITNKKIMQGYDGQFRPQDDVTRAEIAQIIDNLLKYIEENNIADIVSKNVIVQSLNSTASGVIISDKYILTAKHVVDNSKTLFITFYNKTFVIGKVHKIDENSDLALIECDIPSDISPINLAADYKLGESVYTIGNPDNYIHSLTKGIISYINREYENNLYTQFDAEIYAGSSGGALVDIEGNLIGIVSKRATNSGIGLAVPLEQVKGFLENN